MYDYFRVKRAISEEMEQQAHKDQRLNTLLVIDLRIYCVRELQERILISSCFHPSEKNHSSHLTPIPLVFVGASTGVRYVGHASDYFSKASID